VQVVGGRKHVRLWAANEVRRMYPIIQRPAHRNPSVHARDSHRDDSDQQVSSKSTHEEQEDDENEDDKEHEQPLARSSVDSSLWCSADRFPLFSQVPMMEATLEAGDAVFIPRGWWHEFTTFPDPAVSFNWWFSLPDHLDHLQLAARHRPTMLALYSERYEKLCCRCSGGGAVEQSAKSESGDESACQGT
jgi:hypothetical protein